MPTIAVVDHMGRPDVSKGVDGEEFQRFIRLMSMIKPPVALAAIAAASITKTNANATGFAAMRIGWAAYISPFLFIATPALLMDGTWAEIAGAGTLAIIGVGAVCVAMVGFLGAPLGIAPRMPFATGGTKRYDNQASCGRCDCGF